MILIHRLVLSEVKEVLDGLRQIKQKYSVRAGLVVTLVTDQVLKQNFWLDNYIILDEISKQFTKEELAEAQWLVVRPAWQQYSVSNLSVAYLNPCKKCCANAQQLNTIVLSSEIKKTKRAFYRPPELDEIFVSAEMKAMLETSELSGFSFRPVAYKWGNKLADNLFQCVIHNVLPPALLNKPSDYKNQYQCPECGTVHVIMKSEPPILFNREVLSNAMLDIYKTYEYFGERRLWRYIVMSGKFFAYLEAKNESHGIIVDDIIQTI